MNYQLVVTRVAQVDAIDICYWLSDTTSVESGLRWYAEYEAAVDSLQTLPLRCPLARDVQGERRAVRQLLFGQYRLLFAVEGNVVTVLNVMHQKQQPRS
ncbi:MAG: type II toxin-antitoxin system RelE/ParE family toxin [Acidobacteria bacterium]|nr:type II toxin-antitoxin system RelE/ParE family toxin [Acidobacteriota bacterium]